MKSTMRNLFLACKIMLAVLWPMTAAATTITLAQTLGSVPVMAWLIVGVFSSISGCVALLNWAKVEAQRIDKISEEVLQLELGGSFDDLIKAARMTVHVEAEWALFYKRLPLVVVANLLGSLLAGSVAFFFSTGLPDFLMMPAIGLSAWAGARFLDSQAEKVSKK
jgi:hypothetical protein